ncbi:MAG: M48 family metalloprotease [Thermodesulfovibrionales bacterium]|jgi:predicted Zn-dependent protease|nr:M48 family metalloprotease [Thermodesulfovibrionales bacterium]
MKTIKSILHYSITSIFLLLTVFGCAINPVTGQRELMFVSESQEMEMGKELYPNALWGDLGGGGEYKDEKLKAYLKDIVIRIHSISHRPNLPVRFAIQNSSIPNAWAIPGYVVITRGLLAALDSEAEFTFVMGHEMGHVSARHSAKQITRGMLQQIGLGAAGIALGGKEYSDIALRLGSIGSSLLLLKYSRDNELEADRLGILYMSKLGYNPENAVSAHRNLEKISQEYMKSLGKNAEDKGFFEDLLSTHPRTSVRIEEIQHIINEMQPFAVTGDGANKEKFQTAVAGLKNTNKIYLEYYDKAVRAFGKNDIDEADHLASNAIKADGSQPAFHAIKGFIRLKRKDYHEAEKYFNTALNLDKDYEPALRGIGAIRYYKGEYSEGIGYLKRSISIFPQDVSAHYFLGMSYYKMRMYKTAIPHLNLFAEVQPRHPEIHGILGICYENINDLYSAYEEYVMQIRVNPTNEMGRHAASRVAVLRLILEGSRIRRY